MAKLELTFSSENQKAVFETAMSGRYRTMLTQGGSGSGKTYIQNISVLMRALSYDNSQHYLIKTDLKVIRSAFENSVVKFLQRNKIPESKYERRMTGVYYYNTAKSQMTFRNGSKIYLRAVKSRSPKTETDSSLLGMEGETIAIDEATTLNYAWYEFFETRCRSAIGCPPLISMSENPDPRTWSYLRFNKHLNPNTLEPLSKIEIEQSICMRIESWDNALQDPIYLEILKNSGNATRFYFGVATDEIDYNQIYQYQLSKFVMRMFNIYAIDPGFSSPTGAVQIGFGGNYEINVRELCYKRGMGNEDYYDLVQQIIDMHSRYVTQLLALLPYTLRGQVTRFHLTPFIIFDSARTDLIKDVDLHFNYKINEYGKYVALPKRLVECIPANKAGAKELSVKAAKKLKIIVDTDSKFLQNEIRKYYYLENEKLPDGDDHLLDAMLYGMRYILEEVYELNRRTLIYDTIYKHIEEMLKKIVP